MSSPPGFGSVSSLQPWRSSGWTSDNIRPFIEDQIQQSRDLFTAPLTVDTPIERGPFAVPSATLTFKDAAFSVTQRDGTVKTILEPMSGHWESSRLVAIMGPSGSGKSTLLDMLAMKKTSKYEGEILVNGHHRDHLFNRIAAYVGQEDVMPPYWTVLEAVSFNLRLKSQANMPMWVQAQVARSILDAFGLGSVAETYIGGPDVRGCSGGQRRRVTLARGVAARASILFCDEPTSGLSATDAETCVKALRIIAKRMGILVVVVIHQPRHEVSELFDDLLLLTSNPGRAVYNGPMAQAPAYWKGCGHPVPDQANPTDWYMDLCTPGAFMDKSDSFVRLFRQKLKAPIDTLVDEKRLVKGMTSTELIDELTALASAAQQRNIVPRYRKIAAPSGRQVQVLLRRKWLLTRRNRIRLITSLLVPVMQGTLMGLMFQGIGRKSLFQRMPFVFILLTVLCLQGMLTIPALIEQRTIMKYDTSEALYSELVFIIVELMVDIPLTLSASSTQVLIMYTLSEFDWKYFSFLYGWAILLFFVFQSLFGCIAATAPSAQQAQTMAIPFNSIFMMFSGFMISKASAPVFLRWVFNISPNLYAFQSIINKIAEDDPMGPLIQQQYGFDHDQTTQGIIVMITEIVILRTLQVLSLKYRNNIQK